MVWRSRMEGTGIRSGTPEYYVLRNREMNEEHLSETKTINYGHHSAPSMESMNNINA